MSDGRLFHPGGPATENARLPRRSLVRVMTRSPRAAEWTAAPVETDETCVHISSIAGVMCGNLGDLTTVRAIIKTFHFFIMNNNSTNTM